MKQVKGVFVFVFIFGTLRGGSTNKDFGDYYEIINQILGVGNDLMKTEENTVEEIRRLEYQINGDEQQANIKRSNIQQLKAMEDRFKNQIATLQTDPVKNKNEIENLNGYVRDSENTIRIHQEDLMKTEYDISRAKVRLDQLRQKNTPAPSPFPQQVVPQSVPQSVVPPSEVTPAPTSAPALPNPTSSLSNFFYNWYNNFNDRISFFLEMFNGFGNKVASFFNKLKTDANALMKRPVETYTPVPEVVRGMAGHVPVLPAQTESPDLLKKFRYLFN
ncbi:hypothetical protein RUM43_004005 [Polyplax serrata]|uniref:Uncharacterized protein n=1 Tax=Polyplax serrata TaxID=468196 RepID=A0AAN8XKI6_POLSC